MRRTRRGRRTAIGIAAALVLSLLLAGCSQECVACAQVRGDADTTNVSMRLCTSPIPNPGEDARACDRLDVDVTTEDDG